MVGPSLYSFRRPCNRQKTLDFDGVKHVDFEILVTWFLDEKSIVFFFNYFMIYLTLIKIFLFIQILVFNALETQF